MEPTVCPNCGIPTLPGFRLCGSCGTELEGAPAVQDIQRFATVVTSDLKGSTALGERLDPETLREVLTLYFDEMQAVFRSHGGIIEKIIGDAIIAVFGLPVRHDDDALRAVEAAGETQRVLASLNDRLEERWGVRLVVRTGVATGTVAFGEATLGQHVLTGDTMQTSSAMEQNAPPLEVLIAQSTYDLVQESVVVEPVEPVTLKGTTTVVPSYRLISVAERPEAGQAHTDAIAAGMRMCSACGQENPETFQICGMCGSSLAFASVFHESRKTVTIVFADPKPTTLDGERPSAEALRDVMSRYFEVMKTALEQHGGTVEKFIGDAVMAVYGLPVRHEDDAVRAVRGAAAMQEALPALNDDFRRQWGLELRNHIGVNSGEVIAGDASLGQRLVTGDAVNTAARLEQAAGPQEVILGDLTYRLARDQIEVEPIPPLTLKGKTEPVPAYRLLRVAQRPAERAAPTTPFVGREEELTRLETTLVEVSATRSCQLLTVIGDAGVGKSRLVREFAGRAERRERSQVLRGRCLPYGDGVTFWPIYEIVRGAAGITDEDSREAALAKIADIARRSISAGDDSAMVVERVAAAIGLSTTAYPVPELFWGIRKLLEAIASRRPLVAIVDDIHVAAPTFLELFDHLLDSVHGSPILLLATARRELLETRTEWAEAHEYDQMVLDPLSADDSDSIVTRLLGGLEASVRERITTAAEGNPLYVEQISAMLIETDAIRQEGDVWVAASASSEIDIPPTIQALVAARLDALHSEERLVVDPASVIGLGFAVEAVTNLVPAEAAPEVPGRLATLTAKQLVRPAASDSDFYRFGHAVIKDAAYRSLLKRTRAELHERFVDWAEPINRERGRDIEFEEILGYHLEQAYRYRGDLGPLDDDGRIVGERAAAKLASAGKRAFGRGDAAATASLLRRAVSVLPTDHPKRIELLSDLAYALVELGQFDEATTVLTDASDAAAAIGDLRLVARAKVAWLSMGIYAPGSAENMNDAAGEVERLLAVFAREADIGGSALACRLLMLVHGTSGQFDQAAVAAQQVVELASEIGDTRLAASGAVGYSTSVLLGVTPVAEALPRSEKLVEEVRGDRKAEAVILSAVAQLHAMEGRFDQARDLYTQAEQLLVDLGPSLTGSSIALESARVEMLAGDAHAAEQVLRRDYVQLEALGERYFRSSLAGFLAQALWKLNRHGEAERFAEIAEELSDPDDVWSQVAWRTVRAKVLARNGEVNAAVTLARQAVDLAAGTSNIEQQADALVDLDEVLGLVGRAPEGARPLLAALALYERKGDLVLARAVRTRLDQGDPL
ncbi:MAG: adenylate/guanylate cyclase domain-containing protein [Chloroflexota bacterium]